MQKLSKYLAQFVLLFLVVTMVLTSCDEKDPVTPAEEHFEAEGVVLRASGIKIAEIFQGVTTDTLHAPEGGLSGHIEVTFLDHDKKEIDAPTDEHMTMSWEIDDTNILDIWQHEGEEGAFEFHLKGLGEGNTNIEFFVKHHDHKDYRSGKFPVVVEHDDHSHGAPIGYKLIDEHSGNVLVTVNNIDSTVTGVLSVKAGETTEHIEVEFFDENNVSFQPEAPPHSLRVDVSDSTKAVITGQEAAEPWAFKVKGVNSGSTSIEIYLMHDGNIGKSFLPIDVNVTN